MWLSRSTLRYGPSQIRRLINLTIRHILIYTLRVLQGGMYVYTHIHPPCEIHMYTCDIAGFHPPGYTYPFKTVVHSALNDSGNPFSPE